MLNMFLGITTDKSLALIGNSDGRWSFGNGRYAGRVSFDNRRLEGSRWRGGPALML